MLFFISRNGLKSPDFRVYHLKNDRFNYFKHWHLKILNVTYYDKGKYSCHVDTIKECQNQPIIYQLSVYGMS